MIDYTKIDPEKKSIGSIYITAGGYVNREFKGAKPESAFGWREMVWKKTPSRDGSFAFSNMDNISTGLIARCEVNVAKMSIEDYMAMRQIVGRQKHYKITFFDMDDCKWVTRDMYCTENTREKFLILNKNILYAMNYSLKFVGTNLDLKVEVDSEGHEKYLLENFKVVYNETPKTESSNSAGDTIKMKATTTETAPSGKHFAGWIDKDGDNTVGYYLPNQSVTIWKDLNLYPWWVDSE